MITSSDSPLIVVTGASSGLGRAICIRLTADGARVIASGRDADRLAALKSEVSNPEQLEIEPQDLSDRDIRLDQWIRGLAKKYGALKGLVCAAGIQDIMPLSGLSSARVEELLQVNLVANMWLAKGFCDKRANAGAGSAIIFISSSSSIRGEPGLAVYAASKGAINSFTRALAKEMAPQGIRVNAVLPGLVKTEMLEKWDRVYTAEYLANAEKDYPLGTGRPEDIAGPVSFLLGNDARWITGACLVIDGGYTS